MLNSFFSDYNRRSEMKHKNYEKLLKKLMGRIKYYTRHGIYSMTYKVKTFNQGMGVIPSNEYDECTRYIVDRLLENHIRAQARAPLVIHVDWSKNLLEKNFAYKIRNNLDLLKKQEKKTFQDLDKKESVLKEPRKKRKNKETFETTSDAYLDLLLDF